MKKVLFWMLAAILICGLNVFTSCIGSDNPVDSNPVSNLSSKLIGKWMVADRDGQPVMTNDKMVLTFVSTAKAYLSVSLNKLPEAGTEWLCQMEANVAIKGNKVTVTSHPNEHKTLVHEFIIKSIDGSQFTANHKVTSMVDGNVVRSKEDITRFTKVKVDYAKAIIGLWECESISGVETYNDANGRLEFMADGTYNFYRKNDAGNWEAVTSRDFQNYFVDGKLVATRWKNQGENEQREWWEVKSLKGNQMVWTALRQNADGSTFQQEVKWKK